MKEEEMEEFEKLIQEYWDTDGDASKSSFEEASKRFLGNESMLISAGKAIHVLVLSDPSAQGEGPSSVMSTIVGLIKRAYYLGKESMVQ